MANTLKLGAGKWATGKDTVLAFNDENNNFKPLPFSFSRASSATVVNQSGLIETVGSGESRIDFKDNTKGALLLEPARTNLVKYSESFSQSYWAKTRASITSNSTISPDGSSNASKLIEDTANGSHFLLVQPVYTTSSVNNVVSLSLFAKKSERDLQIQSFASGGGENPKVNFDLTNGTATSVGTGATPTFSIQSFGNDWFRCSLTYTVSQSNSGVRFYISMVNNNSSSYQGDGSSGIYIWGAQLEQGSYATSYIPTSGSAVTRVVETCNQTTPSGVIGQTEGVVYIDFLSVNNFDGSSGNLFQIKEDNNNRINIYFSNAVPRLFGIENSSGLFNQSLSLITGSVCKLAIKYNSTSTKVFINGSLSHTLSGINNIAFNDFIFSPNNNINYNEIKLYNTALTDAELASLTTI
jgi:hypothetical protein